MEKLKEILYSPELAISFRMRKEDFTRNRKQPFCATLLFMLNLLRRSLTIEIDGFIRHLNDRLWGNTPCFTSSAFIQNRKKIKPDIFKYLSQVIVENFYVDTNDNLTLWKGFRLLAVDGSKITLPFTLALKELFGVTKNKSKAETVQATASVLYDVSNGIVLDAVLDKLHAGERELALKHSYQWKENDLIIYDRGYPSYDFIYEHLTLHVDCLIRAKTNCSLLVKAFVKGGKKSLVTEIFPANKKAVKGKVYTIKTPVQVRLIRVELPGGEIEVLITTLTDSQKYPTNIFKELYFKRWGVETFYDQLKNKLKVEYFTGYSEVSIRQDFFCAIFISNLQSVIVNDLKEELKEQNKGKKYEYKVNTNLSYGFLKNRILELLYKDEPIDNILKELETLFLKNTVPIRNKRTNTRKVGKYRSRTKPKVTKNQRDAI